ncbi:hypothetical protein BY996DRAFT_4583098 [Phakopsora pachyrhizi]|nr:hypothetical protein BY996DRAFT_4583098 [Phakopsora pachyrhizi]
MTPSNQARQEYDEAWIKTLVILFQSCEKPNQIQLSSKACLAITRVENIAELLVRLSETSDLSKMWPSLMKGLIRFSLKGDDGCQELLKRFSHLLHQPNELARITVENLLLVSLSAEVPPLLIFCPLQNFFQRHPDLVEQCAQRLIDETDKNIKESVAKVLRLLSCDSSLISEKKSLEICNSSAIVRCEALKSALEEIEQDPRAINYPSLDLSSNIKVALKDVEQSTADVLFSFPKALIKALNPHDIMSISLDFFCSSNKSLAISNKWLGFLVTSFSTIHPEFKTKIAEEIILPLVFFTKQSTQLTSVAWKLCSDSKIWKGTIFEGFWPSSIPLGHVDKRIDTNKKIVEHVCESVLKLGDCATIRFIERLNTVQDLQNPSNRAFDSLILWAVAPRLSEEMAMLLIDSILQQKSRALDNSGLEAWANSEMKALDGDNEMFKCLYSTPHSPKLLVRISAETIQKTISRLQDVRRKEYCWFESDLIKYKSSSNCLKENSSRFASLCFRIYSFAHAVASISDCSWARRVLATLFRDVLKEESLSFLARLWTSNSFPENLRVVSLLDAATIIRFRSSEKDQNKDYQLLMPSLMIGLADQAKPVRSASLEVIDAMRNYSLLARPDEGGKSNLRESEIYAYDKFYGLESSATLQYISLSDSNSLVEHFHDFRFDILMNGSSETLTIMSQFRKVPTQVDSSKKGSEKMGLTEKLKKRFLCFLMKVICCWDDLVGRVKLLKCAKDLLDRSCIEVSSELIDQLIKGNTPALHDGHRVSFDLVKDYGTLLLRTYCSSGKSFPGKDSVPYEIFLRALECEPSNDIQRAIFEAAISALEGSVFSLLSSQHKQTVLMRMLELASSSKENAGRYVICVRNLQLDTTNYVLALSSLAAKISVPSRKSGKKSKTSKDNSVGATTKSESKLMELSTFLETIAIDRLELNFELFASLTQTLATLLAAQANDEVDIHFPAQMIISALGTITPHLTPDQFHLEGLQLASIVDYMRISLDPHVSQQAILLMAELARLSPEQTCQSMMPIFTFVGAHILQRDDSYSARVVDKAIQALIPPLISRARAGGSSRIKIILSLRELLLMFAGARDHIPKHRRTRLFVRLIEVLGEYNFLAATIMILIDADIDHVSGGSKFDLPMSIWESFSGDLQMAALAHISAEVEALLGKTTGELSILPLKFTEDDLDPDGDLKIPEDGSHLNSFRVQTLFKFIDEALSSKIIKSKLDSARAIKNENCDQALSFLIIQLLEIHQSHLNSSESQHAQTSWLIVCKAAKLVSLKFLNDGMLSKLKDPVNVLVPLILDLLRIRLPSITADHRSAIEPCIKEAISICGAYIRKGCTSNPDENDYLLRSTETLGSITLNATASEESLLSQLYLPLLEIPSHSQDDRISLSVLKLLVQLCDRLGSRLIPQINPTIKVCANLFEAHSDPTGSSVHKEIASKALNLIEKFLRTSASFVLPHLPIVLDILTKEAIMNSSCETSISTVYHSKESLLRCLTKRIHLNDLVKSLRMFGERAQVTCNSLISILEILMRAIKHSKIPEVIKESKDIFNLLLQYFDARTKQFKNLSYNEVAKVETMASSVFLSMVLKLNEGALKPLLLRLIDWAIVDLDAASRDKLETNRGIVLYRVFSTLMEQLQALVVPYFSHLLDHTTTVLDQFADGKECNLDLWALLVKTIEQALIHDSTGNSSTLTKVTKPLTRQLKLAPIIKAPNFDLQICSLMGKLASKVAGHDVLLKIFNSGILEELRSNEEVKVKITCLKVLDECWQVIGSALVPFVPETVGGNLIEALELSEGGVDVLARKVIKRIEEEIGESIEGYLS